MAYFDSDNDNGSTNSGNSGNSDDMKFRLSPQVVIRGTLTRAFGTDQNWGQSIGIVFENARLVEGCIYKDFEKDVFKGFPWDEICGVMPEEEGVDLSEDDADEYYKTSYGSTDKKYELVDARIHGESDPMPIGTGDIILWYGGTKENGPKAASLRLGMLLHPDGNDNVLSEDDVHNWLGDTSGSNWLRDDLQGEEFDYFIEKRDSSESDYQYHHPVLIKTSIRERVAPIANGDGNSAGNNQNGNQNSGTLGGSNGTEENNESSSGAPIDRIPEPVNDFLATAGSLDMEDNESKSALLTDLVNDPENAITTDMVDEAGGRDAVIEMV